MFFKKKLYRLPTAIEGEDMLDKELSRLVLRDNTPKTWSELIRHLVSNILVILTIMLTKTLIAWLLWNGVVAGTFHVTCLSYLQVLAIYFIIHVIK